jgi:hypothetical protein
MSPCFPAMKKSPPAAAFSARKTCRASSASSASRWRSSPKACCFLMNNKDRPGIVGYIGTLMGKHQVNIASMSLSRDAARRQGAHRFESGQRSAPALLARKSRKTRTSATSAWSNFEQPAAFRHSFTLMTRFFKPRFILAAAAFCLTVPARPAAPRTSPPPAFSPTPSSPPARALKSSAARCRTRSSPKKPRGAGQNAGHPRKPDARAIESDILRHMVIDKITGAESHRGRKTRVREEVAKYFDEVRKASPSEQLFQQQIKASGKTLDQLKAPTWKKNWPGSCSSANWCPATCPVGRRHQKILRRRENATNFAVPEGSMSPTSLISATDPATQQTLPPDQRREKEKLARDIRDRAEKGEDFAPWPNNTPTISAPGKRGRGHFRPPLHAGPGRIRGRLLFPETNQISDLVESPRLSHHQAPGKTAPVQGSARQKVAAGIKEVPGQPGNQQAAPRLHPEDRGGIQREIPKFACKSSTHWGARLSRSRWWASRAPHRSGMQNELRGSSSVCQSCFTPIPNCANLNAR